MASAASDQTITAAEQIFDGDTDGGGATTFMVRCQTTSAVGVEIHCDTIHLAGEWFAIPAGASEYFRLNNMGIKKVYARGNGGTATIDYGIVAKTVNV